jgi:hypothetical protein
LDGLCNTRCRSTALLPGLNCTCQQNHKTNRPVCCHFAALQQPPHFPYPAACTTSGRSAPAG